MESEEKKTPSRMNFLTIVSIGLPLLWTIGIHVNDLATVLLVILAAFGVFKKGCRSAAYCPNRFTDLSLFGVGILFVLYVGLQPIINHFLGQQGLDFPIFAQVVDSISRRGGPLSSLVSLEWRNYLTHHFSPFLYVPALGGILGVPSYVMLSALHGVGIGLAGVAFWLTGTRVFGFSRSVVLIMITLLIANPTIRHGTLFGFHDEIYALPFIGFGYYFALRGRHISAALLVFFVTLIKESMFLVTAAFSLMAIIEILYVTKNSTTLERHKEDNRAIKIYVALMAYCMVGFLAYFFLQPLLLHKAFDHASKLASFSELMRPHWIAGKAWFLIFIGLPFLWYPTWHWRQWHLLLPAVPLILIVLVSSFEEMWKPLNYYGILPSYIFGFAAMIAYGRRQWIDRQANISAFFLALMVAFAFSWSGKKPLKGLLDVINSERIDPTQLSMIPDEAKVITSPAGSMMLFRVSAIWQLALAEQSSNTDYDFIVVMNSEVSNLNQKFLNETTLCHSSKLWHIRCRNGGTIPLRKI